MMQSSYKSIIICKILIRGSLDSITTLLAIDLRGSKWSLCAPFERAFRSSL